MDFVGLILLLVLGLLTIVSAVGFYIMHEKTKRLEKSLNDLINQHTYTMQMVNEIKTEIIKHLPDIHGNTKDILNKINYPVKVLEEILKNEQTS